MTKKLVDSELLERMIDYARDCANRASLVRHAMQCSHDADVAQSALDAPQRPTAKQQFLMCDGDAIQSPVERLRFFCSLAMHGQDWLDVEQFFNALSAPQQEAVGIVQETIIEDNSEWECIEWKSDRPPVGTLLYTHPAPSVPEVFDRSKLKRLVTQVFGEGWQIVPPTDDRKDAEYWRICCENPDLFIDAAFAENKTSKGKAVIESTIDAVMAAQKGEN